MNSKLENMIIVLNFAFCFGTFGILMILLLIPTGGANVAVFGEIVDVNSKVKVNFDYAEVTAAPEATGIKEGLKIDLIDFSRKYRTSEEGRRQFAVGQKVRVDLSLCFNIPTNTEEIEKLVKRGLRGFVGLRIL